VIFRGQKIQLTAVKVLIAINVLVFIFKSFFGGENGTGVDNFLGLSWRGISNGNLWQVFTYQFVHAGSMHLLLNMVGLWFTGPVLERLMGVYRFVAFYLIAGAVGGLLHMLIPPGGSLVGASGSICGLVAAFSALFPRMPITALLFFRHPSSDGSKMAWIQRCHGVALSPCHRVVRKYRQCSALGRSACGLCVGAVLHSAIPCDELSLNVTSLARIPSPIRLQRAFCGL